MSTRIEMLVARLKKNDARIGRALAREDTDCFRVYDHDIPELPFTIERMADHVVITEVPGRHARTDAEHQAFLDEVERAVGHALGVSDDHVVSKRRVRRLAGAQWERRDVDDPRRVVVKERGLRFIVSLADKIDTGLFLDHRNLRRRVEQEASEKRVLNLFCYTGAFTVAAARGGARRTVSVDLSNTALARLEENLRENALLDARHVRVRDDCMAWLARAPSRDERFDLVVLDPPSASKSKSATSDLDVQRDHVALVERSAALLAPGGVLYFSTNLRTFALDQALSRRLSLEEITDETVPQDFRGRPHRAFVHRRR